jgi:membrane protein YdbS with pleckstrin-like domain
LLWGGEVLEELIFSVLLFNKFTMADIQNGQYYSLGSKVFWLFVLQRSGLTIFLLFIDLLLIVANSFFSGGNSGMSGDVGISPILSASIGIIFLVAVLAEIIGFIIARLEYNASKIMLDAYSLKITRGIFSKEEVEIPYRRIQSVEIKQSLTDRMFGVGRLVIASTSDLDQPEGSSQNKSDDEIIPVMNFGLAQSVADALTDRAQVERMQMQKGDISQTK